MTVCPLAQPPSDAFTFVFSRLTVNFQPNKYFTVVIILLLQSLFRSGSGHHLSIANCCRTTLEL